MAIERQPPKAPLSPMKTNQQAQNKPGPPEFGKASTLQSPLRNSLFNIPKPGQPRPEHHRTNISNTAGNTQTTKEAEQAIRVPLVPNPPTTHQTAADKPHDEDVVEITRPAAPAGWSTFSAPRPATYSSLVNSISGLPSANKTHSDPLGWFGDLSDTFLFENKFGAPDPYDYIDAGKATENIKALLEGVFEDDEDQPKTRGRKKKLQEQAEDLVGKLQGLKTGSDAKESVQNEEEENDGSVEGLKVKLLPHQVDGVDWMMDKEIGIKKKNGVLPKGGILADDVRPLACIVTHVADCYRWASERPSSRLLLYLRILAHLFLLQPPIVR